MLCVLVLMLGLCRVMHGEEAGGSIGQCGKLAASPNLRKKAAPRGLARLPLGQAASPRETKGPLSVQDKWNKQELTRP